MFDFIAHLLASMLLWRREPLTAASRALWTYICTLVCPSGLRTGLRAPRLFILYRECVGVLSPFLRCTQKNAQVSQFNHCAYLCPPRRLHSLLHLSCCRRRQHQLQHPAHHSPRLCAMAAAHSGHPRRCAWVAAARLPVSRRPAARRRGMCCTCGRAAA